MEGAKLFLVRKGICMNKKGGGGERGGFKGGGGGDMDI